MSDKIDRNSTGDNWDSGNVDYHVGDIENPHYHRDDAEDESKHIIDDAHKNLVGASESGLLDQMREDLESGELDATEWAYLYNDPSNQGDKIYYWDEGSETWKTANRRDDFASGSIGPLLMFDEEALQEMVDKGDITEDDAQFMNDLRCIVIGRYGTSGGELAAYDLNEIASIMQKFYSLSDAQQDALRADMDTGNTWLHSDYDRSGGNEDDWDDIEGAHAHVNDGLSDSQIRKNSNVAWMLKYLDSDTVDQIGAAGGADIINAIMNHDMPETAPDDVTQNVWDRVRSTNDIQAINLISGDGRGGPSVFNEMVTNYVDDNYSLENTYDGEIDRTDVTALMSALDVSDDDQAKLKQLAQVLGGCSTLTEEQRMNVFMYIATGGEECNSDTINDDLEQLEADPLLTGTNRLAKNFIDDLLGPIISDAVTGDDSGDGQIITPQYFDSGAQISMVVYKMLANDGDRTLTDDTQAFLQLSDTEKSAFANTVLAAGDDGGTYGDVDMNMIATKSYMDDLGIDADDQAKIEDLHVLIDKSTELSDDEKQNLFASIVTGGQEPPYSGVKFTMYKLMNDPALSDSDKTSIAAFNDVGQLGYLQNKGDLTSSEEAQKDAAENRIKNENVTGVVVQSNTGTEGSDIWGLISGDLTFSPDFTEVDVTEDSALAALNTLHGLSLTDDEKATLAEHMASGRLSRDEVAMLNIRADEYGLPDDVKNTLYSAIEKSGGAPTLGLREARHFTAASMTETFNQMIEDDAFSGMGLTSEDIEELRKAAINGTMTADQSLLLLSAMGGDHDLSADQVTGVLSAWDYSHQRAAEEKGELWNLEMTYGEDYDGDGEIGDPYLFGPEDFADAGLDEEDTRSLGDLMVAVMIARMESLDSSVATYGQMVKDKNNMIEALNAAISAIPSLSSSDDPPEDIGDIYFDNPITGARENLADYLQAIPVEFPTEGGDNTEMNASQLDTLRTTVTNKAQEWQADSSLTQSYFSNAMNKYNTSVTQLASMESKWGEADTKTTAPLARG